MSEWTTISAMLKSVAQGPAWHGPSVKEALNGVTAKQAAERPIGEAHSVWQILLHMNAWQDHVIDVLNGADGIPLQGDKDWPPVSADASDDAWEAAKRHFDGGGQELRERIMHFDEKMMHEMVRGRDFPTKVMLHGIVHHNLYHLGQIALLKKAL